MFSHVSVCPQSASRESSNARPCYGVVGTHSTGRFSCSFLLPPTAKLREGNVFTPLCHSVHRLGGGGSVQGGLCPRGCVQGRSLSRTGSLSGSPPPPRMVTCKRYASYWNAFLFKNGFNIVSSGAVYR